jgi:hypothetical protein
VDGAEHEVEAKPLTLLFHDGGRKVDVPEAVEINPETTVAMMRKTVEHGGWPLLSRSPAFVAYWACVWGEAPPEDGASLNLAQLHVAGMIVMLRGAIRANKPIFLRQPETYLHPKQQANLADLLMLMEGRK